MIYIMSFISFDKSDYEQHKKNGRTHGRKYAEPMFVSGHGMLATNIKPMDR